MPLYDPQWYRGSAGCSGAEKLAWHCTIQEPITSRLERVVSRLQKPLLRQLDKMPSIRTISNTLTAALGLVLSGGEQALAGHLKHCPINTPLSCHNTTAITNGCCTIIEGLVLSTQFWDYAPATGPSKSWTIHGTWSDFCDGTYPQFCDPDRQYTNITQILEAEGRIPLLKYMKKYWKDYQGNDESFWEHEFNKHGTCFSTLKPSCYVDYKPQQEVGQYFRTTVDLFKTLPSYEFLGDAGIIPSTTKTYSLSDVHAALTKAHGFDVTVQCDTKGALSEIWYYFNVKGSLTKGKFFPTNTTYTGNCPAVVSYLPKVPGSRPTGTPTTTGTPTSTPSPSGAPFTGRGHLNVVQAGKTNGCIIS